VSTQSGKQASSEADALQFEMAVATLKLLADETRLRIVWALLHAEHSVGDLAAHVRARPPAVSQHLAKLRAARLVKVRRDGNRIFYATDDEHVRLLVEAALLHTEHVSAARSG
jgi:DNA-binding transcriptional ArsR family regulator